MDIQKLIGKAPTIIKQAAKSPLGFAALIALLLTIVALVFFENERDMVKIKAFGLLAAVMLFALAMSRAFDKSAVGREKDSDLSQSTEEQSDVVASQAAAICFRRRGDKLEFLLIRSSKGTRLIFPKGNVKEGEALWKAAEREALEEAGVKGEIRKKPLTVFWHRQGGKAGKENSIAVFLLEATKWTQNYEKNRDPDWYTPDKAEKAVAKNREPDDAKELKRVIRMATAELEI